MEIETINIFLPLRILISNRFSFNKVVFGKRRKRKSEKISRASGNCAHRLDNCAYYNNNTHRFWQNKIIMQRKNEKNRDINRFYALLSNIYIRFPLCALIFIKFALRASY